MSDEEWIGRIIDGRYVVESVLGSGGMGVVLRARHKFTGSTMAVKVLKPHLANDPDVQPRFLAEARAANTIGHPNIVQVVDAGRSPDGILYLAMELLVGRSLREPIQRGELKPTDMRSILFELLDALHAAHTRGFIHRDLKPENVFLVAPNQTAKLLDFGIAKVIDTNVVNVRTATGSMLGTPAYMSPEQIQNPSTVDARTDLWAIGVMVFEMLSGRLPFSGSTVGEIMVAVATQPPRSIKQFVASASPQLEQFFATALARDPNARFRTALDMKAALNDVLLVRASNPVGIAATQFDTGPNAPVAGHAMTQATGFGAGHAATQATGPGLRPSNPTPGYATPSPALPSGSAGVGLGRPPNYATPPSGTPGVMPGYPPHSAPGTGGTPAYSGTGATPAYSGQPAAHSSPTVPAYQTGGTPAYSGTGGTPAYSGPPHAGSPGYSNAPGYATPPSGAPHVTPGSHGYATPSGGSPGYPSPAYGTHPSGAPPTFPVSTNPAPPFPTGTNNAGSTAVTGGSSKTPLVIAIVGIVGIVAIVLAIVMTRQKSDPPKVATNNQPTNNGPSNLATPSNPPTNNAPTNATPNNAATTNNATTNNATTNNATTNRSTTNNATTNNATTNNATTNNATTNHATTNNATTNHATTNNATTNNATTNRSTTNNTIVNNSTTNNNPGGTKVGTKPEDPYAGDPLRKTTPPSLANRPPGTTPPPGTTTTTPPIAAPGTTAPTLSIDERCQAGCNAARSCGLAVMTCIADCKANEAVRVCTDLALAKKCGEAATCGLRATCGGVQTGGGTCKAAMNCQGSFCGKADYACGCKCASGIAPRNVLALMRVDICATNCNYDTACMSQRCMGYINACDAQ